MTKQIEELTKTNPSDQKAMRRLKNHIAACNHRLNTRAKLEVQKAKLRTEDEKFSQVMDIVRDELNDTLYNRVVQRLTKEGISL